MKFSKLAINSGLEDKLFAFVPPRVRPPSR